MLIFQRKYLIILYCLACLIMTPFANAKSINRQAYKVCQTNEEAYWNGSSAQCCEKSIKQVQGTDYYTCCEEWQNAYFYNDAVICCNEDPNKTPGNICCKGKADNGIEKAYEQGCCINNPETSPEEETGDMATGQLCCNASAPYYSVWQEIGTTIKKYECFKCQPGQVSDLCGAEKRYACCPNGYTDWIETCSSWQMGADGNLYCGGCWWKDRSCL